MIQESSVLNSKFSLGQISEKAAHDKKNRLLWWNFIFSLSVLVPHFSVLKYNILNAWRAEWNGWYIYETWEKLYILIICDGIHIDFEGKNDKKKMQETKSEDILKETGK